MWDATTTTRSKQEKRAGFYRKGVQERFNQDVKGQTFRRVRVRVAAAAGHHHLGAEAEKIGMDRGYYSRDRNSQVGKGVYPRLFVTLNHRL